MSCNCGCHDTVPATGWRRYVPLIVAVLVVAAVIAGAVLKDRRVGTHAGTPASSRTATETP